MSRRQLLMAMSVAPLAAAFLTACGSSGSGPSESHDGAPGRADQSGASGTPSAADENFVGVTVVVDTRTGAFDDTGTFATAKRNWEIRTRGKVRFNLPSAYSGFDTKYAGYLKNRDSAADVLYTNDAFNQTYGPHLFDDLSGKVGDTSDFVPDDLKTFITPDGKLRALPVHGEMLVYAYNRKRFEDAGIDAVNPPGTWQELYRFAPKLHVGDTYGHVAGWLAPGHALLWFLTFYNSTGQKLLSDDRTHPLFDNDDFELSLSVMLDAMTTGFVDPDRLYLNSSHEHSGVFFTDGAASTTLFCQEAMEALGRAGGPSATTDKSPIADRVGFALMPGVKAGGSGTINGFEGFGVNVFSRNKAAARSFVQEMAGTTSQKSIALGKDYTALAPSRLSILADPDVLASYALADAVAAQARTNVSRYGAVYFSDMSAAFDDVLGAMFEKSLTVRNARRELVNRTEAAINASKRS